MRKIKCQVENIIVNDNIIFNAFGISRELNIGCARLTYTTRYI